MPYTWTEPEVFLTYRGVTVYHTYNNDNINNRNEMWYTCDPKTNDNRFVITDLPQHPSIDHRQHDLIIMTAIDSGALAQYQMAPANVMRWPFSWRMLPRHLLQRLIYEYEAYHFEHAGEEPLEIDRIFKGDFRFYALLPVLYFVHDVAITDWHVMQAVQAWFERNENNEIVKKFVEHNQDAFTLVLAKHAITLGEHGLVHPSTVLDLIDQDDYDSFSDQLGLHATNVS